MQKKKKSVACSAVENHIYKIFPNDLNTNGTCFGGLVMSILDRITLVVAERHSERMCVTAAVDAMHFLAAAHLGEILICSAAINQVWQSSMEIGARVVAQNPKTSEQRHVVSAYFTFVALDENNRPTAIPALITEGAIQDRRQEEANMRKKARLALAHERALKKKSS